MTERHRLLPLDHLFSDAIQKKISSYLCYPCSSHWSHVSSSIYNSTLHLDAKHLILFFNAVNIILFDITALLRANKRAIPPTNDILEINMFDSSMFMNCYLNSQYILDEIVISPLNESFKFKNRLRYECLLRTLYRCKNAESLTLWFDHCQPSSYSLMPIWDKYLRTIANDIIFATDSTVKINHYHLARLRTLKLKFNHSWITNDISSIIDSLNSNESRRWKLIKNLEITPLSFHSASLLECSFDKIIKFWCKPLNVCMICTYLEPKGNEWNDHFLNQLLQKYKELPKSLRILQLLTTFDSHRVPKLDSIKMNISLIPYDSMHKTFDNNDALLMELEHKCRPRVSTEQMIKRYLATSDHLSLTLLKMIAFRNGRSSRLIQYILTYLIKFCQSILIDHDKQKNDNTLLYQKGILRLCCLMLYFIKTFYIEVVGSEYEWIAAIAHKLHQISQKLRFNSNISKLIKRTSISMDKFVRYCTHETVFCETTNVSKNGFIPISLPLVSYIRTECTPALYANSLSFLYATLLTQILYTPSYHAHSNTCINLFKMINYDALRKAAQTQSQYRYLAYQILQFSLNSNRNLWASQEIADILKSTQNPTNSMGYPVFIQRNEFDDELEGIQQQIKESCTRILKYNVTIPLANNPMYFTNLFNVQNDKRLMEFNGILKCKLVSTHYRINETGCRFFSYN
eukprot:35735_1